MLQITIQNTPLDLFPDTKIRYEVNFPYFDTDGIPASTVWHFDIPVSPNNEEIFNFANYTMVRKKIRMYNATISIHSIPIGSGKLTLKNTENRNFRVQIVLNDFGIDFEGVKLNDTERAFNLGFRGSSQAEKLQTIKEINQGQWDVPFRFPMIYVPEFYGEIENSQYEYNPFFRGYLNNYNHADDQMMHNEERKHYNAISPQFVMHKTIRELISSKKWKIDGPGFEDDFFQRIILHNNYALDKKFYKYLLKATYAEDSFNDLDWAYDYDNWPAKPMNFNLIEEDETGEYMDGRYKVQESGTYIITGIIDLYNAAMDVLDVPTDFIATIRVKLNDTTVKSIDVTFATGQGTDKTIYIVENDWEAGSGSGAIVENPIEVLASEGDEIWFEIKLNSTNDTYTWGYEDHVLEEEINHNVPLTRSTSSIQIERDIDETNIHDQVVYYANHLPDIEVSEFLNNVRQMFGMVLFFDTANRHIEAEKINNILNSRENCYDVTHLSEKDQEENEIIDAQPLKISWSEKRETENRFKFTVNSESDLTDKYMKEGVLAYAIDEMAIYESIIENNRLKWQFVEHDFRNYNNEAQGDNARDISLQFAPVSMRHYESKIFIDEFIIKLTDVPTDGHVISFEYDGQVYREIASSDYVDESGYYHADQEWVVYQIAKRLRFALKWDYDSHNMDFELPKKDGSFRVFAKNPSQKPITYTGDSGSVKLIQSNPQPSPFNKISFLPGVGQSPYIDEEGEDIGIRLGAIDSLEKSSGVPVVSSVGDSQKPTLNYNVENSLDEYVHPWAAWTEKLERLSIPLAGVGIWEMMEIIEMNMPTREEYSQPRWIRYKGVNYLPDQASFIIDVQGNIKESEIVVRKNREE